MEMEISLVQSLKLAAVHATGLSKDALHIYVGLAVYIAGAFLTRRRLISWLPFIAVLVVSILGEGLDMADDFRTLGHWRWRANVHDIMNTAFWPAALTLLARSTNLFQGNRRKR